jgi:tRNA-2-methylthio-N6-dimethylallyladenosine synthase
LPGLRRLRFVTSHPRRIDEDFLRGLADLPKVCEHFHIPFQSGDDEVLKRMNRGYTHAEYTGKIKLIREYFPDAAITADVIVGFSGETEAQFENTYRLVEEIRPDQLYAFKYSVRPGTPAAEWEDDVPRADKEARLARLIDLENVISREINRSLIGSEQETMVYQRVNAARFRGRTRTNKITDFKSDRELELGEVVNVKISGATPHALQGERT